MKILHLVYDHMHNPWVGGGGAVRVYELCRRLASADHEVTVVSGRFPGADDYHEGNLRYVFVGTPGNYLASTFSYAFKAAAFVRKWGGNFDIIVEDFAPWNPLFSSLLTARPVVLHVNHREGAGILRRWWILGIPFYLIEKWYPRLFRNVTALSEETRRKINVPSAFIVPAGINGPGPGREAARGKGNEETFMLYVGRLHIRNKGLDVLLSAMKSIEGRLVLAGRGRDENRLKQMARGLGLSNVEFPGFVSEEGKIALLKADCIFVLPSRFEGWGIVVLEAAVCGRPVVVSDIPELRYAVDAGFAISFKSGDANDLVDKLKYLLGNKSLRREMGLKARGYAERYNWDKIAADYERYLRGVAAASDLQKKIA